MGAQVVKGTKCGVYNNHCQKPKLAKNHHTNHHQHSHATTDPWKLDKPMKPNQIATIEDWACRWWSTGLVELGEGKKAERIFREREKKKKKKKEKKHGFKNRIGPAGLVDSTGNRPSIRSGYG